MGMEVPIVPDVPRPSGGPNPMPTPPAPSARGTADPQAISSNGPEDPTRKVIAGATAANGDIRLVRCLDCRHSIPNEWSPKQGWCSCGLDRHRADGWPAKPRQCQAYENGKN